MDEKDISWQNRSKKDYSTSTFDQDNIQLGGRASPMYLAKYLFPFVILKFALYKKGCIIKNKIKTYLCVRYIY